MREGSGGRVVPWRAQVLHSGALCAAPGVCSCAQVWDAQTFNISIEL